MNWVRSYAFERFDKFRGVAKGLPYIDEWGVFILQDPVAAETAMRGGTASNWFPSAATVDRMVAESGGKIALGKAPGTKTVGLFMNMDGPDDLPWIKDVRVREAFYRFIDREQMLNLGRRGHGSVPPGTLPDGLLAYQLDPEETQEYYRNDLTEAKQLLDAANFDYNREWEILANQSSPEPEIVSQVLQEQMSQVGVKSKVVALPFGTWFADYIGPAKFEITITDHPAYENPQVFMRQFHTDQQSVFGHFGLRDPEVDALIEKSEVTTDFEENVKLVKQIQSDGATEIRAHDTPLHLGLARGL